MLLIGQRLLLAVVAMFKVAITRDGRCFCIVHGLQDQKP